VTDSTELDAYRRARGTDGLDLWTAAETRRDAVDEGEATAATVTRHAAAIASAEASALPGETALVETIQAMLRQRYRFDADDVRTMLTSAGVPDTLDVRRRYASRIINGGKAKGYWRPAGKHMTTDAARSGREITRWEVIPATEG
jgi:hypothetical protein